MLIQYVFKQSVTSQIMKEKHFLLEILTSLECVIDYFESLWLTIQCIFQARESGQLSRIDRLKL